MTVFTSSIRQRTYKNAQILQNCLGAIKKNKVVKIFLRLHPHNKSIAVIIHIISYLSSVSQNNSVQSFFYPNILAECDILPNHFLI